MSELSKKELIKIAAEKEADNYRRLQTIKLANKAYSPNNVSDALKMVGVIGGAIILGRFANKLAEKVEEMYQKSVEPIYFEKMLKKNPALMEEDVEEVADLWGTMYQTAPHLSQDPIAAGAFITQNINARVRSDLGGPTIDTYKTLTDIEKGMRNEEKTQDILGSGLLFT